MLPGGVAEWTMAAVLKTANPHGFMGSNPIPSARSRCARVKDCQLNSVASTNLSKFVPEVENPEAVEIDLATLWV